MNQDEPYTPQMSPSHSPSCRGPAEIRPIKRPMGPASDSEEPIDLPCEGVYGYSSADYSDIQSMMRPAEMHLAGLRVEFERLHRESDELQRENELLHQKLASTIGSISEGSVSKPTGEEYTSKDSEFIALPTKSEPVLSGTRPPSACSRNTDERVTASPGLRRSLGGAQTDTQHFGRTTGDEAVENLMGHSITDRFDRKDMSLLFSKNEGSRPREYRVARLHEWFERLVPVGGGGLSSSRLLEILESVHGSKASLLSLAEIDCVISFLHKVTLERREQEEGALEGGGDGSSRSPGGRSNRSGPSSSRTGLEELLHFSAFADLILFDNMEDLQAVPEIEENAVIIRDALMRQHIDDLIVHYARIPAARAVTARQKRVAYIIGLLDPIVGAVILLNGLTIGLSSDVDWDGWDSLEVVFTVFFLAEIFIKLYLSGFRQHFCGEDWSWNWFDAVVVFLAVVDAPLSMMAASGDAGLSDFSLVRMARLARLTRMLRLIRILRLRIFKELLLMVKGVVAGLRTLFWAIIMLIAIVYSCAVLLRQTVGQDHHVMKDIYRTVLFGTVPWSMFSAFRCFMSDCTLPDGTPIAGHMYELYGYGFVLPYSLMTMFIIFGIFNMVTAVFVENVMESARQRQQLSKENEQRRVAELLRNLVLSLAARSKITQRISDSAMMWTDSEGDLRNYPSVPLTLTGWFRAMSDFLNNPAKRLKSIVVNKEARDGWRADVCHVKMNQEITRENFVKAIEEPRVSRLIDELEVNVSDRTELFDVLDSDGSGCLDIGELISGIMKLRSSETKHDIVALILGMRGIRDNLRDTSARVGQLQHLFVGNGRSTRKTKGSINVVDKQTDGQ